MSPHFNHLSTLSTQVSSMLNISQPLQDASVHGVSVGAGSFLYKPLRTDVPLRVWYYWPVGLTRTSDFMVVMHGVNRDAKNYRDVWVQYAVRENFLLVVPEFSQGDYPGSKSYNLGNIRSSSGQLNPVEQWTFMLIEELFDYLKRITNSSAKTYNIFGHSAGAQFVHRLVMLVPNVRVKTAIAANAGWYTIPTETATFPYGLGTINKTEREMGSAFEKRLIVLLGTNDTDTNHERLRKDPEVMIQGCHRLERGQYFFEQSRGIAERTGLPFYWELNYAQGVSHDFVKISSIAAGLLK